MPAKLHLVLAGMPCLSVLPQAKCAVQGPQLVKINKITTSSTQMYMPFGLWSMLSHPQPCMATSKLISVLCLSWTSPQ